MSPDLKITSAAALEAPAATRLSLSMAPSGSGISPPRDTRAGSTGLKADPGAQMLELARRVAADRFPARSLATETYCDGDTGRVIYRVSDRLTGEVLMQEPPEDLLRFYAVSRGAADRPLLSIDA
jgi:hypothetical protein